jgi:hypothetical protein
MFACEYPNCGAEYTSALAASICEDEDAERDRNSRQWFSGYNPHRKD